MFSDYAYLPKHKIKYFVEAKTLKNLYLLSDQFYPLLPQLPTLLPPKLDPVDWSLKSKLRFTSFLPFSWSGSLRAKQEAEGTVKFTRGEMCDSEVCALYSSQIFSATDESGTTASSDFGKGIFAKQQMQLRQLCAMFENENAHNMFHPCYQADLFHLRDYRHMYPSIR